MGGDSDVDTASEGVRRRPPMNPRGLLFLFVSASLVTYVDRGAIASNGVNSEGVQQDFGLSDFQDGVLASAFMVGLVIGAPVFAEATKYYDGFSCMFVGLTIWCLALLWCAVSPGYGWLVAARCMVGLGEASFINLAAPFINAVAPRESRSAWLAIFYATIPVGIALGYAYGGLVTGQLGLSWRWALAIQAIIMAPFAVVCLVQGARGVGSKLMALAAVQQAERDEGEEAMDTEVSPLVGAEEAGAPRDSAARGGNNITTEVDVPPTGSWSKLRCGMRSFCVDLAVLTAIPQYVGLVAGYSIYTQVVGAYAFWGPKAGKEAYEVEDADTVFAALIGGSSLVGTIAGGWVLDSMPGGGNVANAAYLCALGSLIGGLLCMGAFVFDASQKVGFFVTFGLGSAIVFSATGPVNSAIIWVVQAKKLKPSLQSLAMSMSTVGVHVFGDVPSPPIVGLIQDQIHNWRVTVPAVSVLFIVAAAIWTWTGKSAKRHRM